MLFVKEWLAAKREGIKLLSVAPVPCTLNSPLHSYPDSWNCDGCGVETLNNLPHLLHLPVVVLAYLPGLNYGGGCRGWGKTINTPVARLSDQCVDDWPASVVNSLPSASASLGLLGGL
jgi:hypothetical protein